MKQWFNTIFLIFMTILAFAQDDHKPLLKGNDAYQNENYPLAEEEYLRAIESNPNSVKGHYNRGNAIYKGIKPDSDPETLKERLNKAAESYLSAIENAPDKTTKANAYHNLGNSYMEQQDYKKGIDAYKHSLRLNPQDMDTKTNLQYALRQLQQQQQQQQQQQDGEGEQGEQQEQQEQEPSEGNEEQEGESQDSQEQEEPKEEQEGGQSQEGNKEDQPSPEEMTKEEVLRQLKVMDEEEKKVQEKLKKEQRSEYRSDKDW